jgi:uncharacterized protein YkwD
MTEFVLVLLSLLPPTESITDQPVIAKMHKTAMEHRKNYSLKPQILDKECCEIAQKWAENMAVNHSMYHGGGEQIIAVGYTTPESVFRGWLASSGHRYWVLSNTDKCGWGAAKSSTGRWYWAGVFRNNEVEKEPPTNYVPRRRRFFKWRR